MDAAAHRGLAETTLSVGVDISAEIGQLYAPPAAWSHGYLWGADIVAIPEGTRSTPRRTGSSGRTAGRRRRAGKAATTRCEIDSPTAVRTLNALLGDGVTAQIATQPFTAGGRTYPAGSAIFDGALRQRARPAGTQQRAHVRGGVGGALPALEPLVRRRGSRCSRTALTQEIWVLRNLGFTADPIPTGAGDLNNPSAPDPLAAYDVVFNQAGWPAAATRRRGPA